MKKGQLKGLQSVANAEFEMKQAEQISNAQVDEDTGESQDNMQDGNCFGNYMETDKECKKCLLIEDCRENTHEKRTAKKAKSSAAGSKGK